MESILTDNINNHLEQNSLIRYSQHGFGAARSSHTKQLRYMEIVTKLLDKWLPVVVYLQFSKTFDKVPHNGMIYEMKTHEIWYFNSKWIESWRSNRYQRVILDGRMSDWLPVISGVPQGSILGPILYIVYTNDLDVNLSSYMLKFADDAIVIEVSSLDKVANIQ